MLLKAKRLKEEKEKNLLDEALNEKKENCSID